MRIDSPFITGSAEIVNNLRITGSLIVTGTVTAQTIISQTITSSVLYSSGSNIFGNNLSNVQSFTGSVSITGSLSINGTGVSSGTGSVNYITKFTGTSAIGNSQVFDNGTNVGIDTVDPAYKLDVAGTIRATGDVIAYSDSRVKESVTTINNALEKVLSLRGVTYIRKDTEDKSLKMGVIAQEVLAVIPEVVQKDTHGNYSVAYGNMVGLLIEAVKEQQKQIYELKDLLYNRGT